MKRTTISLFAAMAFAFALGMFAFGGSAASAQTPCTVGTYVPYVGNVPCTQVSSSDGFILATSDRYDAAGADGVVFGGNPVAFAPGVRLQIVDPVPCGGPITGTVSGGTPPYTITISTNVGDVVSTMSAPGDYSKPIPAGASGTYTYSVSDSGGLSDSGSYAFPPQDCVRGAGGGAGAGGGSGTAGGGANSGGGLAVTGSETTTPVLLGAALIAIGGLAVISSKRREFVS